MDKFIAYHLIVAFVLLSTSGCQSTRISYDYSQFSPHIENYGVDTSSLSLKELCALQIISTNLVSALMQIEELAPSSKTVQVSKPKTVFGNTTIRALEDAGYGIQWVSADQGPHYVSYEKRIAETDSGPVITYAIAIGRISASREYKENKHGVYPSSLLAIAGTSKIHNITLDESMFSEQGGNEISFISGVLGQADSNVSAMPTTIVVSMEDHVPLLKRISPMYVFGSTLRALQRRTSKRIFAPLSEFILASRLVLLVNNENSLHLGKGNKQALRNMASLIDQGDLVVITSCLDMGGEDSISSELGRRVKNELVIHGVDSQIIGTKPCEQASYKHELGGPTAVSIGLYRTSS